MRAPRITSYYNRVTPAYKDIQQRERADAFDRQITIASQALFCFAIILLFLNIINQVMKLCG